MRRAALRIVLVSAVTIVGVVAGSSAASAGDPLGTLDPVVSTVLGQTTVVADVTGDVTGGDTDLGTVSGSLPSTGDVTGGTGGDSTDGGVVGDAVGVVGDTTDSVTGGSSGSGGSLVGTVDGTVDGTVGSVDGTVDGTVGTVDGALDGTATGSGTIIGESGTIIGGSGAIIGRLGTLSSGDVARLAGAPLVTVFDRLPPRVEKLLERILLGDHVAANLRRLERLLDSAPPELRDRVIRVIRIEIRRLQRHGVTNGERRVIHRLRLGLRMLTSAGAESAEGPAAVRELSPLATGDGRSATIEPLAASTRANAGAVSAAGSRDDDGGSSPWTGTKGLSLLIVIALLGALSLALIAFSRAPVDALPPGRLQKLRTTSGFEIGVSAYVLLAGACALLVLTHVSTAISL